MTTERRANTSEKILHSASELFFRHGFGKVSVDAIASDAGTTKVTVYQHFRSKECIFIQCLERRILTRDVALNALFSDRPASPALLLEYVDWMQASVARNEFNGCAFTKAVHEMSQTLPEVLPIAQRAKLQLRRHIAASADAAHLAQPEVVGDELALILEGAQTLSLIERSLRPFQPARSAAIKLLAHHAASPDSLHHLVHEEVAR